jgi:hypothetical protein
MNPKPPNPRTAKSGWLGHQTTRLKGLAVVGALTLGAAGAAFAAAAPASADPAVSYVAIGSDTTENVMDGWAAVVSNGTVGSYDAVNPVTGTAHEIITPAKVTTGTPPYTNCSFTRPNGSTEGFNALDYSSTGGASTLAQDAVAPQSGCIDISRSSSAPGINASGAGSLDPTAGNLVYIPFALDAVTGATGPTTSAEDASTTIACESTTTGCGSNGTITFTPSLTNITTAGDFTITDLKTLYASCGTVSEGGITYNPATATTGQQQIDLYVPQAGSGTLKFWAATLGFSATSLPSCVHDTILAGPGVGESVEEHDGSDLASDPDGYAPNSIAKWISMENGLVQDVRHDDQLQDVNGISPFSGTKMNTSFPIIREVYNVVAYDRVVNTGDGNYDPVLSALLATTSSSLCRSTFTINQYGFAALPTSGGPTPDQCGSTASTLRVQQTEAGPS